MKNAYRTVVWKICLWVSYWLKISGGFLLDIGWKLGDYSAINHYIKTDEGKAMHEEMHNSVDYYERYQTPGKTNPSPGRTDQL